MQDYTELSAGNVTTGDTVGTHTRRRAQPIFRRVSRVIPHDDGTVAIYYASGSVIPEVLPRDTKVLVRRHNRR